MDLKMDKRKHDLVFANGKCPVTDGLSDNVAQRLSIRLRTFITEWFTDTNYGVPWFNILGQRGGKTTADVIIQEQIRKERDVIQLISFKSSLNGSSRHYECEFRVRTSSGVSDVIYFNLGDV